MRYNFRHTSFYKAVYHLDKPNNLVFLNHNSHKLEENIS